jgi:hypothetical protein
VNPFAADLEPVNSALDDLSALHCMARRADGGPGYTNLRTDLLPQPMAARPDQEEIHGFVTANPRAALAGETPAQASFGKLQEAHC